MPAVRALVVLPTRDLASQVYRVFARMCPAVGLTVGLMAGKANEVSVSVTPEQESWQPGVGCQGHEPAHLARSFRHRVQHLPMTDGRSLSPQTWTATVEAYIIISRLRGLAHTGKPLHDGSSTRNTCTAAQDPLLVYQLK